MSFFTDIMWFEIDRPRIVFRSVPRKLSRPEVEQMILQHNFFEKNVNWDGEFRSVFTRGRTKPEKTIVDRACGLMWPECIPNERICCEPTDIGLYLKRLNRKGFAGFSDWRLPTLEEALTLFDFQKNSNKYLKKAVLTPIGCLMNDHVGSLLTADQHQQGSSNSYWAVNPDYGTVRSESGYNAHPFVCRSFFPGMAPSVSVSAGSTAALPATTGSSAPSPAIPLRSAQGGGSDQTTGGKKAPASPRSPSIRLPDDDDLLPEIIATPKDA